MNYGQCEQSILLGKDKFRFPSTNEQKIGTIYYAADISPASSRVSGKLMSYNNFVIFMIIFIGQTYTEQLNTRVLEQGRAFWGS